MSEFETPRSFIIAAPSSGSGKTIVSLGLIAALNARGIKTVAAKTGPDYIDGSFLSLAANDRAINLDPWSMDKTRLRDLATSHCSDARLLLVEGVMGLFDGAMDGTGSTADLAASLQLPIILVVDASSQSHSIAALVSGFINWRSDISVAGIILNNVASIRHEKILCNALKSIPVPLLGIVPRQLDLQLSSRHLGLVLAEQVSRVDDFVNRAGDLVEKHCDLNAVIALSRPIATTKNHPALLPIGQNIAIAKDAAFAFIYQHWLNDWKKAGAATSFFSPLANEAPSQNADAIFLPGGYPELFGEKLALSDRFFAGLASARNRGALIYGECGGFMVLGKSLKDKEGNIHKMSGLLPHSTSIEQPKRVLGYRNLVHASPLPWPTHLKGHEFHYSASSSHNLPALFQATDATGAELNPMGGMQGKVLGSYAHIVDSAENGGDKK